MRSQAQAAVDFECHAMQACLKSLSWGHFLGWCFGYDQLIVQSRSQAAVDFECQAMQLCQPSRLGSAINTPNTW